MRMSHPALAGAFKYAEAANGEYADKFFLLTQHNFQQFMFISI